MGEEVAFLKAGPMMNSELVSPAIQTEDVATVENDERAQGEMIGFEKVWEEEKRREG